MVKPNAQHDYYRDLELAPRADPDEIKKQYFRLARLYHPDRNPGKVDEYTPKFQAIQEAHEVLSDPATKAKYDADRARLRSTANAFKANAASGRRGGAYNAGQPGFAPTSQQANAQQKGPPPSFGPKASTGANRFNAFRGAPAPQAGAATDAASKASAWARMSGGAARPGAADPPWSSDADTPKKQAGAPPPRPGAFGRANTTRPRPTSMKSGFDPRAPDAQFEPAVTGAANYFTQSRFSDRPPPTSTKTEPRPPSQASDADGIRVNPGQEPKAARARGSSNVAFAEGEERIAAPYRKSGGERVRISTEGINRSVSVKDAPAYGKQAEKKFPPQGGAASRHRSVSPMRRGFFDHPPQNMPAFTHMGAHTAKEKVKASDPRRFFDIGYSDSSDDSEVRSPNAASTPGKPYVSQPPSRASPILGDRPKAQPRPHFSRAPSQQPNQNGAHPGAGGAMPPPVNGNGAATGAPPMYDNCFHYLHFLQQRRDGMPALSKIWSGDGPGGQFPPHPANTASRSPAAVRGRPLALLWAQQPPRELGTPNGMNARGTESLMDDPFGSYAAERQENSFTIPPNNPTLRSPRFGEFRSKSEESINTRFSPGGMDGPFKGTDGYFSSTPADIPDARARRSPRGRQGPRAVSEAQSQPASATATKPPDVLPGLGVIPPPPPMPASMQSRPAAHPIFPPQPTDVKFPDEEWAKQFKDPSWAFQPNRNGSPTKAGAAAASRKGSASSAASRTRPSSKTGPATRPPKPATVAEAQADEAGSMSGYDGQESATSRNSDAMDIDEEPQTNGNTPARTPRVRNVSQQPQRADWRDKAAQDATSPISPKGTTTTSPISLEGFSKVAPFGIDPGAPGDGLENLNELGSGLPVKSNPSAAHPLKPSEPRSFELPLMPKAPDSPAGRPTVAAWNEHVAAFAKYMRAWFGVQKRMQSHFETRRRENNNMMINATGRPGGMDAWLNTFGEARDEVGVATYLRTLREDERVREHWNVLCDAHREAVEAFAAAKERVLQNGLEV